MDAPGAAAVHERCAEVSELFMRGDNDGVVRVAERFAEDFEPDEAGWVTERLCYVLLLRGISLGRLDRRPEAVAELDGLRARFSSSVDPNVRDHLARAMMNKARILRKLERLEDALATYDDVIETYADDPDRRVGRRVSWAMWHTSDLLDDEEERDALYRRLARRHEEGVEAGLDENIAWSMVHRAARLASAGDHRGGIELCDAVLERFGDSRAVKVRRRALEALIVKAGGLFSLGDVDDQLSTFDEVVDRFGEDPAPSIRAGVAEAMRRKGDMLAEIGRRREAAEAFDLGLAMLADPEFASLSACRAALLVSKGRELAQWDPARLDEALVVFDSAVEAARPVTPRRCSPTRCRPSRRRHRVQS